MRHLLFAAAISAAAAATSIAADTCVKPGDDLQSFEVKEVYGPNEKDRGQTFCYVCRIGMKPSVNVFARNVTPALKSLAKSVDAEMQTKKKLRGFVTLLADSPAAYEKELAQVGNEAGLKRLPLTVFENAKGPEEYKLPKDAEVVVQLCLDYKLKHVHTYKSGELNDAAISAILKELKGMTE